MSNILVGYLSYLNDDNLTRRGDMTFKSSESFTFNFKDQDCDVIIINNGSIVHESLKQFDIVNLSRNYYDVAVHFGTAFLAHKSGKKYFAYVYDDFLYHDSGFISNTVKFLETNDVKSMRIPAYKFNDPQFNTKYTTKQQNPDAVRHETGVGDAALIQERVEGRYFRTNWRPNSRPMIWNTEFFLKHFVPGDSSPVMQTYEGYMYSIADSLGEKWVSSFIDGGVCSTFDVGTSVRIDRPVAWWDQIRINVNDLVQEVCR